jgi:hypothetical protein
MVKRVSTEIDLQSECIRKACSDICDALVDKNKTREGSIFTEMSYCGKLISPLDYIDARVSDKVRLLQTTDGVEDDVCGYLLLKSAFRLYLAELKKASKAAKEKEYATIAEKAISKARTARRVGEAVGAVKDGAELKSAISAQTAREKMDEDVNMLRERVRAELEDIGETKSLKLAEAFVAAAEAEDLQATIDEKIVKARATMESLATGVCGPLHGAEHKTIVDAALFVDDAEDTDRKL